MIVSFASLSSRQEGTRPGPRGTTPRAGRLTAPGHSAASRAARMASSCHGLARLRLLGGGAVRARLGEDVREAPCRRASTIPGSLAAVPPPTRSRQRLYREVYPGAATTITLRPWAVVGGRHGTQEDRRGRDRDRADLAPRPRGHRSLVTKRDLLAYRRRLEAELAELRAQRADLEEAAEASLPDATGEVGFDEEFADAGSFTFERERDLSLVDNAKDLIGKVEHALARIDRGGFGAARPGATSRPSVSTPCRTRPCAWPTPASGPARGDHGRTRRGRVPGGPWPCTAPPPPCSPSTS